MQLTIEGIGFWASGLPSWQAACAFVRDGVLVDAVPRKPAPDLLAPNERRRAPDTVALALKVAMAACRAADADPRTLPSVFASMHGELAITDYMCATLASEPRTISPIRFHNSVHNAAAGYWTIGTGCMQPATALSAFDATFAQGLIEAAAQLADGAGRVLLVAYDAESPGPLGEVSLSRGLVAGALVLSTAVGNGSPLLQLAFEAGEAARADDALSLRYADNAAAPMLPLFAALAHGDDAELALIGGRGQRLRLALRCGREVAA